MRAKLRVGLLSTLVLGLAGGASLAVTSCSQTPVNVPLQSFERAQRIDYVCMRIYRYDPALPGQPIAITPEPTVPDDCAPVAPNIDGTFNPNHLFALVTQTTRGEVAVVDMTQGQVVDIDHSSPGINFLPVGLIPTDIASSPDGVVSFVGSAEPNKAAIYALPTRDILGDSRGLPPEQTRPIPKLGSWPVCALPEAPGSIAVIAHDAPAVSDGGAADGGTTSDAGTSADGGASTSSNMELAVVIPGDGHKRPAKLVTLDVAPFLRGAGVDTSAGPQVAPGALAPCIITSAIELGAKLPATFTPGPTWQDGVAFVDGGTGDLASREPSGGASCPVTVAPSPVPTGDAGDDAGTAEAGAPSGGDAGDAGDVATLPGSLAPTHAVSAVKDGTMLYVADDAQPLIHVVDLSKPASPRELAPLLATSVANPSRKVSVGALAVSPPTRDYKRFLYAIDKREGSILVYDVTDAANATTPSLPLTRPHPELNPFQPPDRILFNVPVVAVGFARHDFAPLEQPPQIAAKRGLLCNPNPAVGLDQGPFTDPGAYYRANVGGQLVGLGPARLRGIFGFATLSNGQLVTIDVDDWDAPCRRPDPMTGASSDLGPPEPAATTGDTDPYHVPNAYVDSVKSTTVSLEAYYPVSAPHRPRSQYLLRRDPTTGIHIPNLVSVPQLFLQSATVSNGGPAGLKSPIILPTSTDLPDPSYVDNPTEPNPQNRGGITDLAALNRLTVPPIVYSAGGGDAGAGASTLVQPNVRFAWEDPQVQIDQDWTVTFEGTLPGFDGIAGTFATTDGYRTLTMSQPNALFCRRGVEDARLGGQRAASEIAEMSSLKIPEPARLDHKTGDYVQVSDYILPPDDPYWSESGDDCWSGEQSTPSARHDFCQSTYGDGISQPTDATTTLNIQRDFPILEAYDDHLVLGRFGYPAVQTTQNREIVGADPSNVEPLKALRCCFHHQAHFKVRTGGTWVAVGSAVGYLHHIAADATTNACVSSCEARDVLLNSRAPAVPRPIDPAAKSPGRNSVLAMRNPMFSYVVWNGIDTEQGAKNDLVPDRDYVWKFSTRGQFVPLTVNLAASTSVVSPQSMRYIEPLGQMAVVDGSSQGLVLIDLNNVAEAHAPYF